MDSFSEVEEAMEGAAPVDQSPQERPKGSPSDSTSTRPYSHDVSKPSSPCSSPIVLIPNSPLLLHLLTFPLRWNVFQIPFLYLPLSFTLEAILLPHLLLASLLFQPYMLPMLQTILFYPTFLVKMFLILCPYSGLYLFLGLFPCLLRLWLILVPLAPYLLICSPLCLAP